MHVRELIKLSSRISIQPTTKSSIIYRMDSQSCKFRDESLSKLGKRPKNHKITFEESSMQQKSQVKCAMGQRSLATSKDYQIY